MRAFPSAPSAPSRWPRRIANIVYVGTGETDIRSQHSYGIGMYKSTDAGKTWTHIGLEATRQIGRVVVDPANPNRVYVAALGHVYDANPERGVYRSTDGGATWKKVLFKTNDPDNVGAVDLAIDPKNPRVLYASLWATRRPPWSVYAPTNLPGGGLYKSTDGGDTWKQLTGGLPTDEFVGKIGIAVAPSNPNRLWAVVDDIGSGVAAAGSAAAAAARRQPPDTGGGVYISDDAGATWKLVNTENRLWGRGWYFEAVTVDPDESRPRLRHEHRHLHDHRRAARRSCRSRARPAATITTSSGSIPRTATAWCSAATRARWSAWMAARPGAPGTTSPPRRSITWPPTIASPTGSTARSRIAAAWASARGRARACSRSATGSPPAWPAKATPCFPIPRTATSFTAAAPGAAIRRLNIAAAARAGNCRRPIPNDPNRKTWTLPQVFSQADEALYYANQFVMRSRDRGKTWEKISPDLARLHPPVPANLDPVTAKDIDQPMTDRFGVVYTIGPSPLQAATVWVGTDDGLIHVTRDDGKTWSNVTPPAMTAWSKVSQIEAGHFDAETAYASVDRHRLADNKPYIYRTHDGGKTWQNVVAGIPEGAYVNSVKEDPQAKGLLYAATELRVYVSFNDGAQWQPLQNNMPVTSVRDIVVHGDDLAIATHGRGFWVMDQMTRAAADRRAGRRRSSPPAPTCSSPARPTPSGRAA